MNQYAGSFGCSRVVVVAVVYFVSENIDGAITLRTLIKDVSKFEKSIQYTHLHLCIPIDGRTSKQALIKLS